jgi:hypothetical protein
MVNLSLKPLREATHQDAPAEAVEKLTCTYRAEFATPSGLKRLTELRLRAWLTSSGARHIELAKG